MQTNNLNIFNDKFGFLVDLVSNISGKVYVVGGAVRDCISNSIHNTQTIFKDIDLLISGVDYDILCEALTSVGKVDTVGKSFGIIIFRYNNTNEAIEIALPRTEETTGLGHKDFAITYDKNIPIELELARRDLTMNAIAYDLLDKKIIDPYDGRSDIENKLIRFVGNPEERIKEDPLRIVRAIQFSVRFNFSIEPNSSLAIYNHNHLLSNITSERILEEFNKAFLKNGKDNNHMFINYITNIPFFSSFFGMDLFPVKATIIGDKLISNMVCLFYEGGAYNKLKVDNTTKSVIELVRRIKNEDVFEVMWKKEHLFKLVKDAILSLNNSLVNKINTLTNIPLHPNQLAISSEELISVGYTGKDLGSIQKHLCKMVHEGKIRNKKINILFYLSEE